MASVYHAQGEYSKALELHQKALEIRQAVLGPDHVLVGESQRLSVQNYDSAVARMSVIVWGT